MTFPQFRARLRELDPEGPVVAVAASAQGAAVGLGLAETLSTDRARILSLYVTPGHRRRGIGTALLVALEIELRRRQCAQLEIDYAMGTPSADALERILERQGWVGPEARMLVCRGDRRVMDAEWIQRVRLPSDFSVFRWRELRADERHLLKRAQQIQPCYPENLSPFYAEDLQDPATSLGLRHQGHIVAWLITHRVSAILIQYSSLFLTAEIRGRGCALPLVKEAFSRHVEQYGRDAAGAFAISVENKPMVRFVRRMTPYLLSVRETRRGRKFLS